MPPKAKIPRCSTSHLYQQKVLTPNAAEEKKQKIRPLFPLSSSPPYLDIQRPASARAIPQAESQVKGSCRMRIAKTAVTTGVA